MALVIGIIVGALGFIAIGGFLVYYIMKRKRIEADRLAEEDADEDYAPVQKFQSKKKPNAANRRRIQQDEEDEDDPDEDLDEDDSPPPPPPVQKKLMKINNAPVHPYDDPSGDQVDPFQPIAAAPIKLPPVNKLPPPSKAMAYDFTGGFQGPGAQVK